MHYVDKGGILAKYLTDPARKIPNAHLKQVCRKGKLAENCRYIAETPFGCWCGKNTPIRVAVDDIVSKSKGGARGDNCPGFGKDDFSDNPLAPVSNRESSRPDGKKSS